jgi:carboxylate-amine ligase
MRSRVAVSFAYADRGRLLATTSNVPLRRPATIGGDSVRGVGEVRAGEARDADADGIAPALLGRYRPGGYDEVVDAAGGVRPHYREVMRILERLGPRVIGERIAARDAELAARGVLFRVSGQAEGRPFPFDLIPRIVTAVEWARLRDGVAQRVRALEAFLRDAYSEQAVVADGIVPAWVVRDAPGLRARSGAAVPADAVRVVVGGIDLVRDGDGRWLALEDNLRVPSGVGYAIESRRLTRSAFPELCPPADPPGFGGAAGVDGYDAGVGDAPGLGDAAGIDDAAGLGDVPALLYEALAATAPAGSAGAGPPSVAVVTSGATDSAYFEHAFLAEAMGVPLVESPNLVVIDDVLHIIDPGPSARSRSSARGGSSARSRPAWPGPLRSPPTPVDVLYRRFDEEDLFAAPGADGAPLGPSLLRALRAGTLSIANAPGNGLGDDKVVYGYVPRMIEYYLGERPVLDDVPTYVCGDPEQLDHVLGRLDELVVKPVDGYGGAGIVIGPQAEQHELADLRERLPADPRRWVAQEPVALSTHPTWHDGRLEPCAVDLRAFAYQGADVVVAPAALSRVAPPGSLIVNSSRGGGSKDTWLLRP